jgi:N-acyl amino acid synthase of PEP-CTERM/exosortase system
MSLGMLNPGAGFSKYFEVVPAVTSALRDEAFRIRHSVYCEDLQFEPTRSHRRETDEFDAQSVHCLLRNVNTGEFAGCTRLIRTLPGDPQAALPFETACTATLDRSIVDPRGLPRARIGEVSRLAVVAKYRRRKGEHGPAGGMLDNSFGEDSRPRFPYLLVGLYLGIIELALRHGIETIFVLTEPRLAGHFARLGVKVTQIGAPVEHHGLRVPSMMNCRAIVEGLNVVTRPLYQAIVRDVDRGLARATDDEVEADPGA